MRVAFIICGALGHEVPAIIEKYGWDADVYGVEFAYRAGYHPGGLRDYLRTLKSQEGHAQSRFFTTHPSTTERIEKIDAILKSYSDLQTLPFLTKRFRHFVKTR